MISKVGQTLYKKISGSEGIKEQKSCRSHDWLAVKEPKLSYHNPKKDMTCYISIIW